MAEVQWSSELEAEHDAAADATKLQRSSEAERNTAASVAERNTAADAATKLAASRRIRGLTLVLVGACIVSPDSLMLR